MSWTFLVIAGLGEIGFVSFMKLSEGFTKTRYTILTVLSSLVSFYPTLNGQ